MHRTFAIVVLSYFVLLLIVSFLTNRKANNNKTFFIGDRKTPWYIIAIGMVGTSVSGVSFVSVPGMVRGVDMTYMQMVFGFFIGYIIVAKILLPLYYRLNLISIYSYLENRFGKYSYKTGASFFILSKTFGSAVKLYLVIHILQTFIFDFWQIPFWLTTTFCMAFVWLYTFRGGIKTLIWTDMIQTICLVAVLVVMIWKIKSLLGLDFSGMVETIANHPNAKIFEFSDWHSKQHFLKQFLSGIFVVIVMTGLDQDMMQKNLACRNLKDAQKNMYWYGFAFTPFNLLFLSLGILLLVLSVQFDIPLPASGDDILPMFSTQGILGNTVLILFALGIIAAAFNSVDSALTSLTTSFYVDLLGLEKKESAQGVKIRFIIHLAFSILMIFIIILVKILNNQSLIDTIYTIVSYTYGPLLGLYFFGLFTKKIPRDKFVPYICVLSPILCYLLSFIFYKYLNYRFGYELLMINGFLTFVGLWLSVERPVIKQIK